MNTYQTYDEMKRQGALRMAQVAPTLTDEQVVERIDQGLKIAGEEVGLTARAGAAMGAIDALEAEARNRHLDIIMYRSCDKDQS